MLRMLVVLIVVLLIVGQGLMQDDAGGLSLQELDPGVLFYQEGTLYNLTAEGQKEVRDVSALAEFMGSEEQPTEIKLSPDGTKLIFGKMNLYERIEYTYYVFDLVTGTCCIALPAPANTVAREGGVFNPDGTQFAAVYFEPNPSTAHPIIVVFDLTTNEPLMQIATHRFGFQLSQRMQDFFVSGWIDRGIIVQSQTVTGSGGRIFSWNPQTDDVKILSPLYGLFSHFLVTGESVSWIHNPDNLLPDAPYGANVVIYLTPVINNRPTRFPQMIYFNLDNTSVMFVQWVADGQAVLIQQGDAATGGESEEAYLLWRDGTKTPFSFPLSEIGVMTTRDGWISQDSDTGLYVYHRLNGKDIEDIPLDVAYLQPSAIVERLPGISLQDVTPFPEVTAP